MKHIADLDPDTEAALFVIAKIARTLTGKKIINKLRYGLPPEPDDLVQEEEMRPGSTM